MTAIFPLEDLAKEAARPVRAPVALATNVTLRRIPHPFRAMLAVCSDLDETPDRRAYAEIMRYLNTTESTVMGPGLGLEVGNTIYFEMPAGQFAYWNTDDVGRGMARNLIRAGFIDCLHSFGDLAATRAHAARSLEELSRHDCRLSVWVDHAVAPTNFGPDIMRGRGDLPADEAYHADLTCQYGIKYVWRGRVTSVAGQDVRRSLSGILDPAHAASWRTLGKETFKGILAGCGNTKYAMHAANLIQRVDRLRDGRAVFEFLRCNPYWGGVGNAATAEGFAAVLTDRFLDRLVARGGVCILYTHLGKIRDLECLFGEPTREAWQRLALRSYRRDILVTTTARLLQFLTVRDYLEWSAVRRGNRLVITIEEIDDPVTGPRLPTPMELGGLTFEAPRAVDGEIRSRSGAIIPTRIESDGNRTTLTCPLQPLEFPSDSRTWVR